jgi:hypothetical protein
VEVEDVKRVYALFIDEKRSMQFCEEYQKSFAMSGQGAGASGADGMECS